MRPARGAPETFLAQAGKHREHCSFTVICPIKGAGTVLS